MGIANSVFAAGCVVAVGLAAAGFAVGRGLVQFKHFERSIEVRGLDERIVKSNEASWRLSFTTASENLQTANTEVGRIQDEIRGFLVQEGFEDGEIQKAPVLLNDTWANSYGRASVAADGTGPDSGEAKRPRYTVHGSFVVSSKKVDQVTKAAEKTDTLLKRGVLLESSGVSYYFTDLNAIKPDMLRQATANAQDAARSFAQNAQARVGQIKSATQGVFTIESPYTAYDAESSVMKKIRVVTRVEYFLD